MSDWRVRRRVVDLLYAMLATSPVVAITGPRTAGKSTLARELTATKGGTLLDLDDPAVRRLAEDDPTAFVGDLAEPVVLDEFQRAPNVLAAIKAELNRDRRPGRFVLTGSARHDVVPDLAEFLTGRVELLTLWPFARAELIPGAPSVVDRLFDGSFLRLRRTSEPALSRADVVDLVLQGGYPIAVGLPPEARTRWFANLATLAVERIAEDVAPLRRTDVAGKFLRLSAARTGQLLNAAEIGRDVGIGRDQAGNYLRLFELAYLVLQLPAWSTNLSSREAKRPKIHLVDSGLAAHLQGITAKRLSPVDPAAVSRFGALLETFVVTEVIKQLGWASQHVDAFHFRTNDGVEVDLVLEAMDGQVCAIEVKAAGGLTPGATRGLEYLRDRLAERFVAGLVLTMGSQAQRIGDRLAVAPIDTLWT
jgi:predicted AAA+ superfamily ATPase